MKNTSFNIVITFGAVAGIGIAVAAFRIATSPDMQATFLAMTITVAVLLFAAVTAGIGFAYIHLVHKHRVFRIDADARQTALDALRAQRYVASTGFDRDHAQHLLAILFGTGNRELVSRDVPEIENGSGIIVRPAPERDQKESRKELP